MLLRQPWMSFILRIGALALADRLVSPCYGAKVSAPLGTYITRKKGPVALLSVLFPRMPDQSQAKIRNLYPKQGKGLVSLRRRNSIRSSYSGLGDAVPEEDLNDADFEWAWMRRGLKLVL